MKYKKDIILCKNKMFRHCEPFSFVSRLYVGNYPLGKFEFSTFKCVCVFAHFPIRNYPLMKFIAPEACLLHNFIRLLSNIIRIFCVKFSISNDK